MNKTLILTVLLGVTALAGILYTTRSSESSSFLRQQPLKYQLDFQKYIQSFQKVYSHDEALYKYKNFENNMQIIETQNALYESGASTYYLGVNHLADLSQTEYKEKHLMKLSQEELENVEGKTEDLSMIQAPSTVDWVSQGKVNSVKNQGQCGSCWAFSTITALEGLAAITQGRLQSFSEQSLVDCAGSYGCDGCQGGWPYKAMAYAAAHGVPLESSYSYTAKNGACKSYTSAFKNTNHYYVTRHSESALINAASQQPVSILIEADTSAFQLYKGGILNDSSCGTRIDHAVNVVGYGPGYFKVRNSWGARWGESGYIRMARLGNGYGQCGILTQPSYPR